MLRRSVGTGRLAALVFTVACTLALAGCAGPVSAPVSGRGESESRATAGAIPPTPEIQEAPEEHLVTRGDTLYSIAWRYGQDYRAVAAWNGIGDPYVIYPGQRIRLRTPLAGSTTPLRSESPEPSSASTPAVADKPEAQIRKPAVAATPAPQASPGAAPLGPIVWRWPTEGNILPSDAPTSKKGVDISGNPGQGIHAAARGAVVYSGSGLLGYGRLIIIKHSDTYLSAYAHNDTVLVKEGDNVAAGQQIATMGRSGNSSRPMLHFEIRKDGQPVNPLSYLPRRSA